VPIIAGEYAFGSRLKRLPPTLPKTRFASSPSTTGRFRHVREGRAGAASHRATERSGWHPITVFGTKDDT